MKSGKTIQELAAQIQHQNDSKLDYIADTRSLTLADDGKTLDVAGETQGILNRIAETQIANALSIPQRYYDAMQARQPQLLAQNVNTWFHNEPSKRLVRTIEGESGQTRIGRAFLSSRYRAMDNLDLANAILPFLAEQDLMIRSCDLTDSKLYLKATFPQLQRDVKVGDTVEAGIMITNSEVGCGALAVTPLIFRLVCSNGMIVNDAAYRKCHVGKNLGNADEDNVRILFADDTKAADDKALWLKVRDVVKSTLNAELFEGYVRKFVESTEVKIEGDPIKAVERLANRTGLYEDEKHGVIRYLIEGGDLSAWGAANAITRTSQDCDNYDRATELETIGGKVIELGDRAWAA